MATKKGSTKGSETAKKAQGKKGKGKADGKVNGLLTGRPGIIGAIVELLQSKPHSRAELLAGLTKRFPDRPEKGMKTTIYCQVPKRLISEKTLTVKCHDDGRFSIPKK